MNKRTLESEIQKITGVVFRSIPADGLMRKFMVGRDEWSAISFGNCGAFGCFRKSEFYAWPGPGEKCGPIGFAEQPKKISAGQLRQEREIIAMGNALQDSGQAMGDEDFARYLTALTRSIAASQYEQQANQQ